MSLCVMITGANGFVGSALMSAVSKTNISPIAGLRESYNPRGWPTIKLGDIGCHDQVVNIDLSSIDVVVHTAARAHVAEEDSAGAWEAFHKINVQGTLNLARQAAQAGVKRFVFISSIGVNGKKSTEPFTECHPPEPTDPYARSKWEAEEKLKDVAKETGMELVVIRPPLVYGPDAPGNFGLLTKVATKGLPLPLAGIQNRRSFVSIWNLVDFITRCIDHPEASGETFVVADGVDVSTSDLLRKLARAAGRPSRLFWLPEALLKVGATALGKRGVYERLFDSLQVDASHARRTLDWAPPLSLDEGLERCFCHLDEGRIS